MDTLHSLMLGFSVVSTPTNLFYCFIGVLIGTLVGVLPGIGTAGSVAVLLPFTFGLPPATAIILLAGIWYGAMYGGSTASILVNIPGESSSVVTCIDGYQMARQGRAGRALGISAIGSFVLLLVLSAVFTLQSFAAKKDNDTGAGAFFHGEEARKRVVLGVVGLLGYRYLIPVVGFAPATGVFIFFLGRFLESYTWKKSVFFSAATAVSAYYLFQVVLKIEMPIPMIKF
jgi:hypothetical protein